MGMISEVNALEYNDWWIDSNARRHACKQRNLVTIHEMVEDRTTWQHLSTAIIEGKVDVDIESTSKKFVILNDVYHVPHVRKNLLSGSILNNHFLNLLLSRISLYQTNIVHFWEMVVC